jgi:hypothetical protein
MTPMIAQYTFPKLSHLSAPIASLARDPNFVPAPRPSSGRLRAVDAPTRLLLDDQRVIATARFWRSLSVRCGLNESVFRYFEPD